MRADIESEITNFLIRHKELEKEILILKFGIYESLEWESAAEDVVKELIDKGYEADGNMKCYLNNG